jgi:hypothetical protein
LSKQQPTFHDLKFSSDADFWAGSAISGRYALLMPVTSPVEFVAFGVIEPSKQVHFVARGRLKEDLAAFLTVMGSSGGRTELYVQAPVPKNILKRYTGGPPIEHQESEEPSRPPVQGLVPAPETPSIETLSGPLWTEGDASEQRVLLIPTHTPAEFFALGMLSPSNEVVFKLRGSVRDHLGEFITRMVKDHALVELRHKLPAL